MTDYHNATYTEHHDSHKDDTLPLNLTKRFSECSMDQTQITTQCTENRPLKRRKLRHKSKNENRSRSKPSPKETYIDIESKKRELRKQMLIHHYNMEDSQVMTEKSKSIKMNKIAKPTKTKPTKPPLIRSKNHNHNTSISNLNTKYIQISKPNIRIRNQRSHDYKDPEIYVFKYNKYGMAQKKNEKKNEC